MDFIDASDAPVTAVIGEKTIQFPVWDCDMIRNLLSDLRGKAIASCRKSGEAMKLDPQVIAVMMFQEEIKPLDVWDAYRFFVNEGANHCLIESLVKGQTGTDQAMADARQAAKAAISPLWFEDRVKLAIRVARLYRPKAPAMATAGKVITVPNANAGLGLGDPGQTVPAQPVGLGDAPADPQQPPQPAAVEG